MPDRDPAAFPRLPLRELTGWEEEFLDRHQHEPNTARTCNEVLARCCVPPGQEPGPDVRAQVRGLLVAERERELVRLRRMSLGPDVAARVTCPACGAAQEASFSLDALDLSFPVPPARTGLPLGELTLDLPTAGDQEELLDAGLESEAERRTWLLGRCLRDSSGVPLGEEVARGLPVRRRADLEREVDAQVPALDLEMALTCQECDAGFVAPFDVAVFFFRTSRAGRPPRRRRAPARVGVPLVRARHLGAAAQPAAHLPDEARGRRGRRAARGARPVTSVRAC